MSIIELSKKNKSLLNWRPNHLQLFCTVDNVWTQCCAQRLWIGLSQARNSPASDSGWPSVMVCGVSLHYYLFCSLTILGSVLRGWPSGGHVSVCHARLPRCCCLFFLSKINSACSVGVGSGSVWWEWRWFTALFFTYLLTTFVFFMQMCLVVTRCQAAQSSWLLNY